MATVTVTSSVFDRTPVQNATGNITVSGQYNSGATDLSVADVIFLAKIPHGASVIDICVDHSDGETALALDYGMATGGAAGGGADLSLFTAALAIATVGRMTARRASGVFPVVSVSDSSAVRYGVFAAYIASGTGTDSVIINFSITYRCDN